MPNPIRNGRLFYVMGASGVGKDSVLAHARTRIGGSSDVVFAHRYLTRPAELGHENYVSLSAGEFALRQEKGLFKFAWQAHGLSYGIGIEIDLWREAGLAVVVSGSRQHFTDLGADALAIVPILIEAPAEILRQRLLARGRESAAEIDERLARGAGPEIDHPALRRIDNGGALAVAGEQLVAILTGAA